MRILLTDYVFSLRMTYHEAGRMKLAALFENVSSGISTTWRVRSACASSRSDQGLHCPLRIIGYYRMFERRVKARMLLCACAGLPEYAHFAHVRWHVFAWLGLDHAYSLIRMVWMVSIYDTNWAAPSENVSSEDMWTQKAQIRLRIRAVWSGHSLSTYRMIGYWKLFRCITKVVIRVWDLVDWSRSLLNPYPPKTHFSFGAAQIMYVHSILGHLNPCHAE